MKTAQIYALCEPGTRTIRYIGMTTIGVKTRFRRHLTTSMKLSSHLGNWLRRIRDGGNHPAIIILSEVPETERQKEEILYIRCAKALGFSLVNLTEGGEGVSSPGESNPFFGKTHSEETRKKMSLSRQGEKNHTFGKRHSEESKRKISEAQRGEKNHAFGKSHSEETRKKISLASKGRRHSEETRRKLGAARMGDNNPFFGRTHSEETRRKMRLAKKK